VKSFGQERAVDEKLRQKRALINNDGSLIFQEKTGLCVSGFRLAASVIPGNPLLHAMNPRKNWRQARFAKTSEKQNSPGLVRQCLLAAQMARLTRCCWATWMLLFR